MRKVIAYGSLDELMASPIYDKICDGVQFAESVQMAKTMAKSRIFPSCHVFNELINKIDPYWQSDEQRVRSLALISMFIRSRIAASNSPREKDWLTGCLRRSFQIWSAVALLEEADLRPENIESDNKDVRLMVDIWKYLIESEEGFISFRKRMSSDRAIIEIRKKIDGWMRKVDSKSNVITIHGFYFITPIQERVIRLLYESGYEIYFLIPYRGEYPLANQVWDALYCESNGYDNNDDWIQVHGGNRNLFGDLIEGKPISNPDWKIKEYKDVMAFVDDIQRMDDNVSLYSPDNNAANDILQDFFPERYGRRKLYSYPIGGFIKALHGLWDDESQSLLMDSNTLIDCFASGWISYKGVTSDVVLKDLERMVPFFKKCLTMKDWEDRSKHLFNIHVDVISRFKSDNEDGEARRWEDILDNPFSNFSIFDVPRERVELIIGMMNKLLECAKFLFEKGASRDVNEHTDRLIEVLDDNRVTLDQDNEFSLATSLLNRIRGRGNPEKYNPTDMVNAITLFLSNEVPVDDAGDSGAWVRPLFDMGANTGDVHICMCSQEVLPGKQRDYVWPLNPVVIQALEAKQRERDKYPLIWNTRFITESNSLANRFLMFDAFCRGHVTLSWISDDGRPHAPSPYITLMAEIAGSAIEDHGKGKDLEIDYKTTDEVRTLIPKVRVAAEVPEVAFDTGICPRRYLYGYILKENPSFSTDFHYGFAIGGLLSAIKGTQGTGRYTRDEIEQNVFNLFPFLLDVEKRNIIDRTARPRFTGSTRFRDVQYTDYRLGVHFPSPLWDAMEKSRIDLRQEIDILSSAPAETSCMYCPHSDCCPNSMFKGDGDVD